MTRWETAREKAEWARTLIRNLEEWMERKRGDTTLPRRGSKCIYCNGTNDSEVRTYVLSSSVEMARTTQ